MSYLAGVLPQGRIGLGYAALREARPETAAAVHVRPELVVEIAFGDVQRSPHYPAGLALRFARVKRYRLDKRPEEADTLGGCARSTNGGTPRGRETYPPAPRYFQPSIERPWPAL